MGVGMRYQPQGLIRPSPAVRGLEFLASFHNRPAFDCVKRTPITYGRNVGFNPFFGAKAGSAHRAYLTPYSNGQEVTFPAWNNTTNEVSLVIYHNRVVDTSNLAFWAMGGDNNDQYPYNGNVQNSSFWSSRWMDAPPPNGKSFLKPHVIVVTVKNGEQRAYWDGILFASNNLTGGFKMPSTLAPFQDAGQDRAMYMFAAYSRVLSPAEITDISANPWQLFEDTNDDDDYLASAAPSTINAALAWMEADDTASLAGLLTNRIAAAWTEAGDTAAIGAVLTNRGAAAWIEGDETATAASTVTNRGALTWTEAGDVMAATGLLTSPAAIAWTEAGDYTLLHGEVSDSTPGAIYAALAWTEEGDAASMVARLTNRAALAFTEQGDTWALTAYAEQPAAISLTVRFDVLRRDFKLKTTHYSN
jgi:hypothetical protein